VVVRGYYAVQNTIFPALIGTIAVLLSIPVYIFGMNNFGIKGVATALSISAIFQVLLLFVLWNRRSGNEGGKKVYTFYGKIIFISILIGLCLEWFRQFLLRGIDSTTFSGSFMICVIVGIVFLITILAAAYIFRIKEIKELLTRVTNKITGSNKK